MFAKMLDAIYSVAKMKIFFIPLSVIFLNPRFTTHPLHKAKPHDPPPLCSGPLPPPLPTLFDQSLSGGKKKGKQHFRYLKLPRRVDTSL